MTKRFIILLVSCFSVMGLIFILETANEKVLYKKNINSRITYIENYYDKLLYFYYDKGKSFSSRDINDTLLVGDSISKPANTLKFSVFRQKEDSSFFLYKQLTFK